MVSDELQVSSGFNVSFFGSFFIPSPLCTNKPSLCGSSFSFLAAEIVNMAPQ